MRYLILFLVIASACTDAISVNVQDGIERFEAYRNLVEGKRVGIVANHTSRVDTMHSVDFLLGKDINVVRIFCPEHGFRGTADAGETVGDYVDAGSGLKVVSLYGKKKKPQPEDLAGIDVMIFDMQDVGVRFYTYLSTLHYVMEACAEQDIPLIVMDRPNPNAFYVDGPVLQKEFKSFVGMHPVPVVYGMTIGEYAGMVNGEGWLKDGVICNLTVILCEGWNREQPVTLPYAPSPNLPDSVSIMLYPSTCFFEGTVVNEGRGTLHPFQVFGHPSLKGMPYSYVPRPIKGMSMHPKCKGQTCYGMDLRGEYYAILKMKRLNLAWLLLAYQEYEGKEPFFNALFNKLVGNDKVQQQLKEGVAEEEIRAGWQDEVAEFMKMREKYLLYD
ncbi:MAG TPA: DUF1343 domain-containing protein [Candidatus Butyricimonas faecavium]|nr:DUF1343 domain-containing protein [Candidatus Butyricimonas faecavium]